MQSRRGSGASDVDIHDSGYFQKLYNQDSYRDTTNDSEISSVMHPLATANILQMKKFNCMQKAITYCIVRNGGTVHEDYIIRFLDDHWTYVNSDRPHAFTISPGVRLLHINTQAKKKNILLFIRDPHESKNFMCNALGDAGGGEVKLPKRNRLIRADPKPQESDKSDSGDGGSDEPPPPEDPPPPPLPPAPPGFDDRVLSAVSDAGEATIEELTSSLADQIDNDGLFRELSGSRRIRAVLIVLKSQKKVICVDGKWRVFHSGLEGKHAGSPASDASQGVVPVKDMTLSDFYLFVKEHAGL